ncbi:MAG: SDR family NAD(P)-dependent oxidoreductase [Verrucomicrobia bacterium]|nr:SDR family NAD(P)-dependent oxidoreductase [Verrucomicrobiota bacterium]
MSSPAHSFSTIIITGASSGIGKAYLQSLLQNGSQATIINLSRTEPKGLDLPDSFFHLPCDLSKPQEIDWAADKILSLAYGKPGRWLLINNSGFGSYGPFPEPNLSHTLNMLDLNIRGLVHLTAALLPNIQQQGGAIINIASTAAWQPTPYMAAYGASKSFVLQWSLALAAEQKEKGIQVLAVCPGPTESDFFRRAGFGEAPLAGWGQTAAQVVDATWNALGKGRTLVVSGFLNRCLCALSCRLPKVCQAPIAAFVLRRMRLNAMKSRNANV